MGGPGVLVGGRLGRVGAGRVGGWWRRVCGDRSGAQGTIGAQGATGAVSGLAYYETSQQPSLSPGRWTVVDAILPQSSATAYTVTATTDVRNNVATGTNDPGCRIVVSSSGGSYNPTPTMFGFLGSKVSMTDITDTGAVGVAPDGLILDECYGPTSDQAFTAQMSATRVTEAAVGYNARRSIEHKFVPAPKADPRTARGPKP